MKARVQYRTQVVVTLAGGQEITLYQHANGSPDAAEAIAAKINLHSESFNGFCPTCGSEGHGSDATN